MDKFFGFLMGLCLVIGVGFWWMQGDLQADKQYAQDMAKTTALLADHQAEAMKADAEADKEKAKADQDMIALLKTLVDSNQKHANTEIWTYRIAMVVMVAGLFSLPWLLYLAWKQYKLHEAEVMAQRERSTKYKPQERDA